MPSQNTSDLRTALQSIIYTDTSSLRAAVAREALDYNDPATFFSDLLSHGCISGLVSSLIYYTDTHAFFDKHYDAIETLRDAYEDQLGEPLTIKGDLKNTLAWFAFEQTAYDMAGELGINV